MNYIFNKFGSLTNIKLYNFVDTPIFLNIKNIRLWDQSHLNKTDIIYKKVFKI